MGMLLQVEIISGVMCMKAIARNTPPAKELAMPRILGFSRQDADQVGIMPETKASTIMTIMKTILVQKMRVLFTSSSFSLLKTYGLGKTCRLDVISILN